ncbi:MAG: AgmX/PglI C-terminal domain-containing protein, partial [Myxococcota bacterium]|jgi:hypothetical protein|nr:AgmX/PglI C-terminal domain-containing protein [Myxococcota bacterium]
VIGKLGITETSVIDAEEVTTALSLDLQGTMLRATRQKSGPPVGLRRGVTSNWTGAYEGPKGGTLTLMAPHAGTYALHVGPESCQMPLELSQIEGFVEARVSASPESRVRGTACPAFVPGQLAFRLEGLKSNQTGDLVTMAHNGMAFSRPGPDKGMVPVQRPRMMAASIRQAKQGGEVLAAASPEFAREGVKTAIESGRSAVDACYQRRVEMRRGLAGGLFLAWQVDGTGTAFDVRILKDSLEDDPTTRCVVHAVRRMRFPPAVDGSYEVRTPFRFTAF